MQKTSIHQEKTTQQPPRSSHRTARHTATQPTFRPRIRFLRGLFFFLGVVAQTYVWDIFLARFRLTRWYVRRTAMQRWVFVARSFRRLAVDMGGMQIKFGQFLSSRADIIPDEIRFELAGLQDEVPPAPVSHVLKLIEEDFGRPIHKVFRHFDQECVAAASLGQVHFATLHDGTQVAVKVQRPHIEEIIAVDLSAVEWVLRLIKDYSAVKKRADVMALHEEFARVLRRELDYIQEANNAERFRENFEGVQGIYVPYPIKEATTRRVLVMERISGIKITDREALKEAGIDSHELADRLNQTYLKQLFIDGFFHADPHPGNLFVHIDPEAPSKPPVVMEADTLRTMSWTTNGRESNGGTPFTLIFVDFGMVSELPPTTMETVRSGILGLATNNAERIVDALYELKMFRSGADRRPIVQAIQVMLRHSYDRSVQEINNLDVEEIFEETRDLVYDLPFQIPQDLLYLGRAISMVSGLATEIDPQINLFESLRPFARKMLDNEREDGNWFQAIQKEAQELGQILLTLPRQMDAYYKAANRGEIRTRVEFGRIERMVRRVEHSTDRLAGGIVASGLFLGGVQLRLKGHDKDASRAWVAAALALLWSLRHRRDHP